MKTTYFIGIGGIGMSALARYYVKQGVRVHGYDRVKSRITEELEAEGAVIHYEEDISRIPESVDWVIYTPAIPETHQELVWFRERGYEVKKRAEALGVISRGKKTIAVAGTHGKTTTSSIITHVLRYCGVDCTAFLGGIANNIQSNFAYGQSDWMVVEADEYDRSFLHLSPLYSVVTSTDADHLDIYGEHGSMLDSFRQFIGNTQAGGKAFLKAGIELGLENDRLVPDAYGVEHGKCQARNIRVENGCFHFDFVCENGRFQNLENILFPLAGRHNVENAVAAIVIALELGLPPGEIKKALAGFKGIWRRFEFIIRREDFVYIDDYAHHPSELEAAIQAARELFPGREITGIFQPHLFSRTRDFAGGFAKALDKLDRVYLLDIYPARELPIEGVTSLTIQKRMENGNVERIRKMEVVPELERRKPDVLMTLGAGDIDRLVGQIKGLFWKR